MTEKLIDDKVCRYVKEEGGLAIKLLSLTFTGWPDRTCLLPGARIVFAELKSTGKKLRARQAVVRKLIEGWGFKYFVVDNEENLQLFREYIKTPQK